MGFEGAETECLEVWIALCGDELLGEEFVGDFFLREPGEAAVVEDGEKHIAWVADDQDCAFALGDFRVLW